MVALVVWFFVNVGTAIQEREIPYGFGFLSTAYQTGIGHTFLPWVASDSYGYSIFVAAVNTVFVAVAGVIFATVVGVVIGVARLSSNWLVSKLAAVYVEFFRNVPLVIILAFCFYAWLALPEAREGLHHRGLPLHQQQGHIHSLDIGEWAVRGVGLACTGGCCRHLCDRR